MKQHNATLTFAIFMFCVTSLFFLSAFGGYFFDFMDPRPFFGNSRYDTNVFTPLFYGLVSLFFFFVVFRVYLKERKEASDKARLQDESDNA